MEDGKAGKLKSNVGRSQSTNYDYVTLTSDSDSHLQPFQHLPSSHQIPLQCPLPNREPIQISEVSLGVDGQPGRGQFSSLVLNLFFKLARKVFRDDFRTFNNIHWYASEVRHMRSERRRRSAVD
jgi:hypothetical protein